VGYPEHGPSTRIVFNLVAMTWPQGVREGDVYVVKAQGRVEFSQANSTASNAGSKFVGASVHFLGLAMRTITSTSSGFEFKN